MFKWCTRCKNLKYAENLTVRKKCRLFHTHKIFKNMHTLHASDGQLTMTVS